MNPFAVYAAGPQGYDILDKEADFPPAAETALRELARHFRWSCPTREEPVPPCAARWPGEGGTLTATLIDDGRANEGRPHSLRIEAVWIVDEVSERELVAGHDQYVADGFDVVRRPDGVEVRRRSADAEAPRRRRTWW